MCESLLEFAKSANMIHASRWGILEGGCAGICVCECVCVCGVVCMQSSAAIPVCGLLLQCRRERRIIAMEVTSKSPHAPIKHIECEP